MWEGPEATIIGHHTILGHTAAWWARSSGAINQVNVEFDVILGARLIYNAASTAVSEAGANTSIQAEKMHLRIVTSMTQG